MSISLYDVQLLYLFILLSFTESNTSIKISLRNLINGKYVIMHRQKLLLKIYYSVMIVFLLAVPPNYFFSFDLIISPSINLSFLFYTSFIIVKVLLLTEDETFSLTAVTKSENLIDNAYNHFEGFTLSNNLFDFCNF